MKTRAPNLKPEDVRIVLGIIDGWAVPPLNWNALICRIASVLTAYTSGSNSGCCLARSRRTESRSPPLSTSTRIIVEPFIYGQSLVGFTHARSTNLNWADAIKK